MIGRKLGKPDAVTVRKYVPLSEIQGMELPPEYAPQSFSYGQGNMLDSYSAENLAREDIEQDELARGAEMADTEAAGSREQDILDQILQIVAEQQAYSKGVLADEDMSRAAMDEAVRLSAMPEYQISTQPQAKTVAPRDESFSEAFGAARRQGLKVFTWRGKKYTTQMAPTKWNAKRSK
jgi:hypothetical protein